MAKKLTKRSIVTKFSRTLKKSIENLENGKDIFHKGLLLGYFDNEIDEIATNTFISSTGLFPKIFFTIAESLKSYNEENTNDKFTLDVDIISTMLPRHYWNFPINICYTKIINNKLQHKNVLLTCRRNFTDKYRAWLTEFIDAKNDSRINRITLIGVKDGVTDKYLQDTNSPLFKIKLFNKSLLEEDRETFLIKNKTKYKLEKCSKITDEKLNPTLSLSALELKHFPSIKEDIPCALGKYESYILSKNYKPNRENVYDFFLNKLHSIDTENKPEASFCFVDSEISTRNQYEFLKIPITPIPINDIASVTPDYLVFSFKNKNNELIYKAILVGKVDLIDGYVKLNYYDSTDSDIFNEYNETFDLIKKNSYNASDLSKNEVVEGVDINKLAPDN